MNRVTARRKITRLTVGHAPIRREDVLAVEEPLELRVNGRSLERDRGCFTGAEATRWPLSREMLAAKAGRWLLQRYVAAIRPLSREVRAGEGCSTLEGAA